MNNVPNYNTYTDCCGNLTRVVYDGVEYDSSDIIDIEYTEFKKNLWEKRHYDEPYPFAIPNNDDVYLTTYYGGSGDYSIHEGRMNLIKKLEELKATVSPSHPYTMKEAYYNNYPYAVEEDALYYDEDEEDYGDDNRELIGWESMDGAEIVLVKTSSNRVPVYAIRLPKPVELRPVNRKLADLRKLRDCLIDASLTLKGLDEMIAECDIHGDAYSDVCFDNIVSKIGRLMESVKCSLAEQEALGRTSS